MKAVREQLRAIGFSAVLVKTEKQRHAKGVDIALTTDMLSHAFRDNYDVAVLIAGDADFCPLVEEVKRLGKRVHVWFFDGNGMSPELRLVADQFTDLTNRFRMQWTLHVQGRT